MANVDPSLSIDDAAQALGVSARTIRRHIKDGTLKAFKRTTERGFEWRVYPGQVLSNDTQNDRQQAANVGHNDRQAPVYPEQPAAGAPEAIQALVETIEHLREDHRAEVERLERDKDALRQAAEHWQARFLEEHDRVLRLLPAPKEEPAPAEPEQKRPWWKVWGR